MRVVLASLPSAFLKNHGVRGRAARDIGHRHLFPSLPVMAEVGWRIDHCVERDDPDAGGRRQRPETGSTDKLSGRVVSEYPEQADAAPRLLKPLFVPLAAGSESLARLSDRTVWPAGASVVSARLAGITDRGSKYSRRFCCPMSYDCSAPPSSVAAGTPPVCLCQRPTTHLDLFGRRFSASQLLEQPRDVCG